MSHKRRTAAAAVTDSVRRKFRSAISLSFPTLSYGATKEIFLGAYYDVMDEVRQIEGGWDKVEAVAGFTRRGLSRHKQRGEGPPAATGPRILMDLIEQAGAGGISPGALSGRFYALAEEEGHDAEVRDFQQSVRFLRKYGDVSWREGRFHSRHPAVDLGGEHAHRLLLILQTDDRRWKSLSWIGPRYFGESDPEELPPLPQALDELVHAGVVEQEGGRFRACSAHADHTTDDGVSRATVASIEASVSRIGLQVSGTASRPDACLVRAHVQVSSAPGGAEAFTQRVLEAVKGVVAEEESRIEPDQSRAHTLVVAVGEGML